MHDRSAGKAAIERVYKAIKERVVAYDFAPGRRIYLEPIARELGVSTMPVRDALNRLAAENLVIKAPHKGFVAMTLSEANLIGHYELTRELLSRELELLGPKMQHRLSGNASIARTLERLTRRQPADSRTLATCTAEIYTSLASVTERAFGARTIDRSNDHLFYIRTVECELLERVQDELIRICELTLSGQRDELISAIHAYHERRISLLRTLLEYLRR